MGERVSRRAVEWVGSCSLSLLAAHALWLDAASHHPVTTKMAATSWRQGVLLLLFLLVCGQVQKGAAGRGLYPTGTFPRPGNGDSPGKHDNSWCFKGVYDYDNCPGKSYVYTSNG